MSATCHSTIPVIDAPTPERILHRLDWQVIRRLDGLLQGDYRTLFYGTGIDFADLREYQPQDDIRHIDWNVTARMNRPYVRQYVEDREITAWFLLDLSPSMGFGPAERPKTDGADRSGDNAGAAADAQRQSGRGHSLQQPDRAHHSPAQRAQPGAAPDPRAPARTADTPTGTTTDLTVLLHAGLNTFKRRSLVFVISDFISEPGWERPLTLLNRRHELISIRLWDPREGRTAGCRADRGRGRGNRRATLCGHQQPRVPPPLSRGGRAARSAADKAVETRRRRSVCHLHRRDLVGAIVRMARCASSGGGSMSRKRDTS